MKRSAARELAIQICFAASSAGVEPLEMLERYFDPEHFETLDTEEGVCTELPDEEQMAYISRLLSLSAEHRMEIDCLIETYAKGWKLNRISRTALAILRCAVCEIEFMDDIPDSAAINEAVELDKGYDDPDTVAFVNGVLGGLMRGEGKTQA